MTFILQKLFALFKWILDIAIVLWYITTIFYVVLVALFVCIHMTTGDSPPFSALSIVKFGAACIVMPAMLYLPLYYSIKAFIRERKKGLI